MKELESHNDIEADEKKVGTKERVTAALGAPILLSLIAIPAALAVHTFRPVDMVERAAPLAYGPPAARLQDYKRQRCIGPGRPSNGGARWVI